MLLAIDGYEANQKRRVGIGRYAFEILRQMHDLAKSDPELKFRIYVPDPPLPDMPKPAPFWEYRVRRPKKLWTFVGLPLALTADFPRPDCIFSPTHYIPRYSPVPRVMSIMDLSYLIYPEMFKKKDLVQLTRWTAFAAAHAARIFTISEFSRNAIIKEYRIDPRRVIVTYPGLIYFGDTRMSQKELSAKYGISQHYILSVGTIQPRKNYVRLIEAFSLFLRKNKQKFGTVDLVIVGKKGWLVEEILATPERCGIAERVKFLDFVPDEDLPSLYRGALCFALPSLYEGFGLPVLEAMAEGCPVVVSNTSSLPEIAGKAGIYVDPESSDNIAEGLLTAVRERNLIQGKTRIQAGLAQIPKFTWEHAARKTIEVLREVAREGKTV